MPTVRAALDFLAKLPLYDEDKPYFYLPGKDEDIDPDDPRLNNLEYERHEDVEIRDMRDQTDLDFTSCGFQFIDQKSEVFDFCVPEDIDKYQEETNALLTEQLSAVKVQTYEVRVRENRHFNRRQFDLYDKLLTEGPAKGAHNDVTYSSGPNIIRRYLSQDDQEAFLRAGYRVRIFNTWRPLVDVLEDRPLALCDSSSVDPNDLVAADRILPDRVGEIYYLRHNSKQKWYWLEYQKRSERLMFLMYDTAAERNMARFCPHVSFNNPRARKNAEKRKSVETRSIVITKIE